MKSTGMNEMSDRMKKDKGRRWKIRRCKEREKNVAQKESKDAKFERGGGAERFQRLHEGKGWLRSRG
jgi:hypothetical protein